MTNVMNDVIAVWNAAKTASNKTDGRFGSEKSIFMMSDSGARGNISNFTQLAGMRGLMAALMVESWNCQSFRTSVKDYPSWKCLSQLTGLVKG